MSSSPIPCAVRAVERNESVVATASRVLRWLVVEQPGAWGSDALLESGLDRQVAQELQQRARASGVRVLLARSPVRGGHEGRPRHAFLAHSGRIHRWLERVDISDDHDLLDLDLGALSGHVAPGIGSPCATPIVMVCTHGRHDQCCANLGRPVVRALRDAGVDHVWECSHVGGDRFAANLVALPSGIYLGRVPPERAAVVARDLAAGLIELGSYRGRSCYPTIVQAAEILARRRTGERRLDALVVEHAAVDGDQARVRLRHDDVPLEVTVRRTRGDAAQLSCGEGVGAPWRYQLLAFDPGGGSRLHGRDDQE